MTGCHRRWPFAAYTWHVQFAAELATELPACEASSATDDMATARHLSGPGNLAARKADEFECH